MARHSDPVIIGASCPGCKLHLRVRVGRKSTCRSVRCTSCGRRYDYSAWKLDRPPAGDGTVGLHTFYKVEFVETT